MELRRVFWAWETALARLVESDPEIGRPLRRSARPIAAERELDGRLTLALGCWWPPDLTHLTRPQAEHRLQAALSQFLEDQVNLLLVAWPGAQAQVADEAAAQAAEEIPPPDPLDGLPRRAREAAARCESALQRHLFGAAWRRGLELTCQYPILNFRLDFALPGERVAAEVVGWHGPRPGQVARWEREQELGAESWRVLYFAGVAVYENVERCVDALVAARR
jgi:very-short-patch-repair endonuclease